MTGPKLMTRQRGVHRALLFTDDYGQKWGWWCLDCDQQRDPSTHKKDRARKYAEAHAADTHVAA